jgi:hypothetical protein
MRFFARAQSHLVQSLRIAQESVKLAREIRRKMIVVADYYRPAVLLKHTCVVHLLLIFMEGIRHENGRSRAKSNICNRHRTRTRDNQIGAMQCDGDVVDKRHHLSREPDFAVTIPHQLVIRLPGLMDNVRIYNTFSTDFKGIDNTNIQPVRSRRTA